MFAKVDPQPTSFFAFLETFLIQKTCFRIVFIEEEKIVLANLESIL